MTLIFPEKINILNDVKQNIILNASNINLWFSDTYKLIIPTYLRK